ncbi:MAG: hypothetical protein KGP28_10670 [Bdellovibrionales bacterium]|nr:hypothetical protein [Bdellovibrionales bacterium]
MNVLILVSVLAASLFWSFISGVEAHGALTHLAKIDVELGWITPSGRFEPKVEHDLNFRLDWGSKKCELEFKGIFYYCVLDVATDLKDRDGNILMKQLPVAHFGYKSLDALLLALGREDESLKNLIPKFVKETTESREKGFTIPFYTCESCMKDGERVPVWNAFDSYVRRTLEMKHPMFSSRRLALVMKIHRMKALGGSFNIIGRTNADSFIENTR